MVEEKNSTTINTPYFPGFRSKRYVTSSLCTFTSKSCAVMLIMVAMSALQMECPCASSDISVYHWTKCRVLEGAAIVDVKCFQWEYVHRFF